MGTGFGVGGVEGVGMINCEIEKLWFCSSARDADLFVLMVLSITDYQLCWL